MKKIFDSIPKFLLGPIAVIIGIFYFVQQDPPKTICDIQFEIFKKETEKYIFGYKEKKISISPGIKRDIESCEGTNSPGGCYDLFEGLKKILKPSRSIPSECRDRIGELDPFKKWLDRSLFDFSQISWNNSTVVRMGLFNWFEQDDIILFCRLKAEYIRLIGPEEYKTQETKLLKQLVELKKLPPNQVWGRTVLSFKCPILN
jgi:hypothetical protein